MSYRRMGMNGFLDDLFGDEEAKGEARGQDTPTQDMSAPAGTRVYSWECMSGKSYPLVPNGDPPEENCHVEGIIRQKDGKWAKTYGAAAATGDNPVSTFLRDLFGGGSTQNTLPAPVTAGSVPSGGAVVTVPGGGTVIVPAAAPPGPSPLAIAFGAACVLGAGYAAYKYL